MKKNKKVKKITMRQAKLEAARLGLEVNVKYDKRCLNTWLYTIGMTDVIPVERKEVTHVPKKPRQELSRAELKDLAKQIEQLLQNFN